MCFFFFLTCGKVAWLCLARSARRLTHGRELCDEQNLSIFVSIPKHMALGLSPFSCVKSFFSAHCQLSQNKALCGLCFIIEFVWHWLRSPKVVRGGTDGRHTVQLDSLQVLQQFSWQGMQEGWLSVFPRKVTCGTSSSLKPWGPGKELAENSPWRCVKG